MRLNIILFTILHLTFSCNTNPSSELGTEKTPVIFTPGSTLENTYLNFNSPKAINTIATLENEYFRSYENGVSNYFGTVWQAYAQSSFPEKGAQSTFEAYQNLLPDTACLTPLHCTIYANTALQAGLGDHWQKLSELHEKQWGKREYAGWSIAYLLCKHFGWKAYLVIGEDSPEYQACKKAFQRSKKYPVYKQPDIPLEAMLELGKDDQQIQELLENNEFGWGFSYQGWAYLDHAIWGVEGMLLGRRAVKENGGARGVAFIFENAVFGVSGL